MHLEGQGRQHGVHKLELRGRVQLGGLKCWHSPKQLVVYASLLKAGMAVEGDLSDCRAPR